jgi:sulfide:quinone oxidoreductase
MQPNRINADLTVCAQITPADVAEIAVLGFASILCNRPDNEADDQPSVAEITAAAERAGLKLAYQPITPGVCGAAQAADFAALTATLPQPVFAYCRTGTRSATLWALAELASGTSPDAISKAAALAGYDISAALRTAQ